MLETLVQYAYRMNKNIILNNSKQSGQCPEIGKIQNNRLIIAIEPLADAKFNN